MIFAFGCTKSWYKYLSVNLYSLLKNNPKTKKVYLLIESENMEDVPYLSQLKKDYNVEFELINFNNIKKNYIKDSNPNIDTPYTDYAFCKIILPDVVKEDKVIYLDMDTVVTKDVSRLWNWDLGNNIVAGCLDNVKRSAYFNTLEIGNDGKYINTGVMLMDLKRMREEKIIEKSFDILNSKKLKFPDQDALNIVCQGMIQYIPSLYNQAYYVTLPMAILDYVKIWHFPGPKTDWLAINCFSENWYKAEEEFYNKYVQK